MKVAHLLALSVLGIAGAYWLGFPGGTASGQEAVNSDEPARSRVVNVLDFGAKGDAKHDDTQAIQAALDELAEANRGKVVIPAGRYRITDTLTMKLENGPRKIIAGEGGETQLFWDGEAGGTLMHTVDVNHTEFRDFRLIGHHVNKRQRGEGRAGILFLATRHRGGNMINHMTNVQFAHAKVGVQMGTKPSDATCADYYFTHVGADNLDTFFLSKTPQAVDFLFHGLFGHKVGTVLHFEQGGNVLVHNAQLTGCDLYLHIEGGGRNCATFTNINVRLENLVSGDRGRRDLLLKADDIKWEQAVVSFIGFNDVQWTWFAQEQRWGPLCEIGPGVNVTFQNSVFNGPVAEVNGQAAKPGTLVVRESTFGFILPHQAIRANEYGYVKTVNCFTDFMEPLPDVVKWPELPTMKVDANGVMGPVTLPEANDDAGAAIEALKKQRQAWIESMEKR